MPVSAAPIDNLTLNLLSLTAPPSLVSCSAWADEFRYLPAESAAEHGKWRTKPFQREPLDSISNTRTRQVVIKSATQMLKTETILNGIGYVVGVEPGPILILQPGDVDAKDFSKERVATMIRDTPALTNAFSDSNAKAGFRNSDNTITEKLFPGGMLAIAGSGSARNVARRAIRYLFADEVDKYKPTPEGNPLALARKRLATFRHMAKEIDTCSPTVEDSEIDRLYKKSDQREFFVPCWKCGEFQSMMKKWGQVRWNNDHALTLAERAKTAIYYCEFCDAPWNDAKRWKAVSQGEWQARKPFAGIAGFWISELYSPWKELRQIVEDFLSKKDNAQDLKTFTNTSLAENWEEKGDAPAEELLYERSRRERYQRGEVPQGGLFLTAGVDVQKTYLQYEIVAWGRGKESWSIEYGQIQGNPQQKEVWNELTKLLNETYPHESGLELPIAKMAVDTGYATNDVYSWVRDQGNRAIAVDGRDRGTVPVSHPSAVDVTVRGKKITNGMKIWPVATPLLKSELYGWLNLAPPTDEQLDAGVKYPSGYAHIPAYDYDFFKQITAESIITRYKQGYPVQEWQKKAGARNEALDCRVYARAAAYVLGLDKFRDQHWQEMERRVQVAESLKKEVKDSSTPPAYQTMQQPRQQRENPALNPAKQSPYEDAHQPQQPRGKSFRPIRGRFL